MLIYILKFSACLTVFLVFYKLFLEKENMHQFKRFYLISGILLSLSIPFVTFTEYVVTSSNIQPTAINDLTINTNNYSDYLSIALWSVYGMGVFVFGVLFLKNLTQILIKINQNTKIKHSHFTNVLLQNFIIPHTFLNYIFLNKYKFETKQIPKEVLLHEETHAIQKHSLDILFIELLQVIFWFNPLLNLIKKDIKLNHEFLADQAVLKNGFETSAYQNILLTFSSPDGYRDALHPQLANAINYSLIKKRFTVMKTQTSKNGIWFRSLLLLPMLAILLFSFSTKVIILEEKHNMTELENIIQQEKATKEQIKEYNAIVKKLNSQPENKRIIKQKDVARIKYIFSIMTADQKKEAEPFPKLAPPPEPAPIAPKAPKPIKVKELPPPPPPPPIPTNASPEQKKKYEEAIKNYKLKTQKVELRKIKEGELIKVRELRAEDRKQLQAAKLAHKDAQIAARVEKVKAEKAELMKVRELQAAENQNQLQAAKLAYSEAQIAARAEKAELMKIRKLQAVENRNQLQESKLAYKEAQIAARSEKIKTEKEQLKKEKKAYKEAQRKQKSVKKESNNKENK